MAGKLFGTSGIRGKIGSEVTCELALNVGKALAYYLGNSGTVVLGYDTRTTNKMLDEANAMAELNKKSATGDVNDLMEKYENAPSSAIEDELAALKAKLGK